MLLDLFCEKCTLQFDTLHVFDLHLSLVHGEKIRSKNEPLICEEKSQEPKLAESNVSDHLVITASNVIYVIFLSNQNNV